MKNFLFGAAALLALTACSGFNLPVIPAAPTQGEIDEATVQANVEIERICGVLDTNETNLQGWLDFAAVIGKAVGVEVDGLIEIPSEVVKAKDRVCE